MNHAILQGVSDGFTQIQKIQSKNPVPPVSKPENDPAAAFSMPDLRRKETAAPGLPEMRVL